MKKIFILCICCMGYVVDCLAQTTINPENKKEWKLVWKDDFNYKKRSDLLKVWESMNGPHTHIICSRWEENIEVGKGFVRLSQPCEYQHP